MVPNTANTQMNTTGAPMTDMCDWRTICLNMNRLLSYHTADVVVGLYHDSVQVILDRIRLGLPLAVPFGVSRQNAHERE